MTEKPCEPEIQALLQIRQEIIKACAKSGRNPEEVRLLAVTKTVPPVRINRVLAAGTTLIGENRVQEYLSKREAYQKPYTLHFIGHLQTNKVRDILPDADCIESIDSLRLLQAVSKEAVRLGKKVSCLLEWNVGAEENKTGADEAAIRTMLQEGTALPGVEINGLMCVPPVCEAEESRRYFARTRQLFAELQQTEAGRHFKELSMGMSHDYSVAVEEGATIVRVGSALFGARHNQ